MWALIDCNSFFANVERVFHPGLSHRPVCVLSSNDGIIIALTPEAKAIGLRRGDVLFKVRDILKRNDVAVFSTNMTLYSAMSKRITGIIRQAVARVENYSIDESFADLTGYEKRYDLAVYMRELADRIKLWTDIPVSVGVAPTKTLAKIGSVFAKRYPGYRSVCMIDTEERRRRALELTDLPDIWGIGRRSYEKLRRLGARTALDLAMMAEETVIRHLGKPGADTWRELNGHPCIDTAERTVRQSISTSRSFGCMVSDAGQLRAAVSTFAASCANKLRAQGSAAGSVTVFLSSNPFRDDLEQYGNAGTFRFSVPTADTIEIADAAAGIAGSIFRQGIMYKRAGVILDDITPCGAFQLDLFDTVRNRGERLELFRGIDSINRMYGPKTVRLAAEGDRRQPWMTRSGSRSMSYLTDLSGILTVQI